jgi:hypothetical protein
MKHVTEERQWVGKLVWSEGGEGSKPKKDDGKKHWLLTAYSLYNS